MSEEVGKEAASTVIARFEDTFNVIARNVENSHAPNRHDITGLPLCQIAKLINPNISELMFGTELNV